jgi:hypothetical protein
MNKFLFLDIDGVLNDHTFIEQAQSFTLKPECVRIFNEIIEEFEPKVILHSAWRYIVLMKHMTLPGFSYMLRTHGVSAKLRFVDNTPFDGDSKGDLRERVCHVLLKKAEWIVPSDKYVILDDLDLKFPEPASKHFIQTNGDKGLQPEDLPKIRQLLLT